MAVEMDITEDLFNTVEPTSTSALKNEKNYHQFADMVSDILYKSKNKYNIPSFFVELMKELNSVGLTTEEIKPIEKRAIEVFNQKVEQDKLEIKGKPKNKKKAAVVVGFGKGDIDEDEKPAKVAATPATATPVVAGAKPAEGDAANEDYDEEYGDYGDDDGFDPTDDTYDKYYK